MNSGNPSDFGANPVLDHADTNNCQARVLSRELPETTLAKLARTPSSASLSDRLSKNTRAKGERHETGSMVQAEQQLLRRATMMLHVRSVDEKEQTTMTIRRSTV